MSLEYCTPSDVPKEVLQYDGNVGADIVWEWHIWDHLVQDADSGDDNYGVVADHPELFDINKGNVGSNNGPGGVNADWMHWE